MNNTNNTTNLNNIVTLYNPLYQLWVGDKKEHKVIKFINRKDIEPSTKEGYIISFKKFFNVENLEDITLDMILDTTVDVAEGFRDKLLEEGFGRGTVAVRISHLNALFQFIMEQCIDNRSGYALLKGNPFASVTVSQTGKDLDNASESWGSYTREEVSKLIEVALPEYALFYELATMTSVRKEAIRTLNIYENFKKLDGVWCITGWDKTGEFTERIGNELYERCVKIADADGNVFSMSSSSLNRNLKKDSIAIGIPESDIGRKGNGRRLTVHSLKKTGCQLAYLESGGDVKTLLDQSKNGITYATKEYMKDSRNYSSAVNRKFNLRGHTDDGMLLDILNKMESWELVKVITNLDSDIKKTILDELIMSGMKDKVMGE